MNGQESVMKTCVEIVVLKDMRIRNTLDSLRHQTVMPDRILIADGGSDSSFIEMIKQNYDDLPIDLKVLPGLPVETRLKSLKYIDEDITIFLDSDQNAPADWLKYLISPFFDSDEKLAFSGGPTKPYKDPSSEMERYINLVEEHIYGDDLKKRLTYVPLGNTAWRTKVLKELGFDPRLRFEAEDNDLETRAYNAGYHGTFVTQAWVWHDKTVETRFVKGMRKRYHYLVGAATVFIKNGTLGQRGKEKRNFVRHPYAIVEFFLKPVALLHAFIRWNISIKHMGK